MTQLINPIASIKDYIKKGYTVELIVDSKLPEYSIRMFSCEEVKNFTIHPSEASLDDIYRALKEREGIKKHCRYCKGEMVKELDVVGTDCCAACGRMQ
jgi:aspartate carbamoyltransferase regulatory subunit